MQATLTALLCRMNHLKLVGVEETALDAIGNLSSHDPDLVILDLELRQGTGLDVLSAINARRQKCRVLVFTSHDTKPIRTRCLKAGADRFFSKARGCGELLEELLRFTA